MTTEWPTSSRQMILDTVQFFREHPDRWVRGALGVDQYGQYTGPWGPNTHCWCFIGKMKNLCPEPPLPLGTDTVIWGRKWNNLYKPISDRVDIIGLNDGLTGLPNVLDHMERVAASLPEGATIRHMDAT